MVLPSQMGGLKPSGRGTHATQEAWQGRLARVAGGGDRGRPRRVGVLFPGDSADEPAEPGAEADVESPDAADDTGRLSSPQPPVLTFDGDPSPTPVCPNDPSE